MRRSISPPAYLKQCGNVLSQWNSERETLDLLNTFFSVFFVKFFSRENGETNAANYKESHYLC